MMEELEKLRAQKREIEAEIRKIVNFAITCGCATYAKHNQHVPNGKSYIAVKSYSPSDSYSGRWMKIVLFSTKEEALERIDVIIEDLKRLKEALQDSGVG